MDPRNDPFFEEAAPPPMPMFTHMGLGNRRPDHQMSLALSPFGGMGFGGRMGMGLMPFGGASPFSMMNGMMANMNNMMSMQRQAAHGHSFSSSSTTVMQYPSDGQGGAPRVYHAASSTRQGPGGVKETQKAVKDSHTGIQKMAVGHHIGDRSHVIERRVNARTGERAENQEFINLDDTDAKPFGEEWREKTHSLNRASSLVLPIEQSRRNQFSDRRGLPCPQHPAHASRVNLEDEAEVVGAEEDRKEKGTRLSGGEKLPGGERDGLAVRGVGVSKKRKHRTVSMSEEDAAHNSTTRRSPKVSRTKSPPYVPQPTTSSQPQSHTHSTHAYTDIPPAQSHTKPRPTASKQVPKKAEKKTTIAL